MSSAGITRVAWMDRRAGPSNIYAAAVDSIGTYLSSTGAPFGGAAAIQDSVSVSWVAGLRSAILAWSDTRAGNLDIFAQRLNFLGAVGTDFALASNAGVGGKVIASGSTPVNQGASKSSLASTVAFSRLNDVVVDGGSIGTPKSYEFANVSASHTIGATFDTSAASTSVGWIADGAPMTQGFGVADQVSMVADGTGGALLAWRDSRSGSAGYDVYAQRLNTSGMPMWAAGGVVVCNAIRDQSNPKVVADGHGGAFVTWDDNRTVASGGDVYVQHLNPIGSPQWTVNGIGVATGSGSQGEQNLALAAADGVIVSWTDWRTGSGRIFTPSVWRCRATRWTANGVLVSLPSAGADAKRPLPAAISDGEAARSSLAP
jgi:hypothetical protein